jgi:hypothetical protein
MVEVERRLADLAAHVEFPATPDVADMVVGRLGGRARPARARRSTRVLALAALVVAAALAALFAASPDARSTVAHWFGIGGVRIIRVGELPQIARRQSPLYGRPVTLAEAERLTPYRVLLPGGEERPDHVFLREEPPGGTVTLVWGSGSRPRLAISQWVGETLEPLYLKVLGPETREQFVVVDGGAGVWLDEAPHIVYTHGVDGREYLDNVYLAGNTLIWQRGRGIRARSFRLEAEVGVEQALRIAQSLE